MHDQSKASMRFFISPVGESVIFHPSCWGGSQELVARCVQSKAWMQFSQIPLGKEAIFHPSCWGGRQELLRFAINRQLGFDF